MCVCVMSVSQTLQAGPHTHAGFDGFLNDHHSSRTKKHIPRPDKFERQGWHHPAIWYLWLAVSSVTIHGLEVLKCFPDASFFVEVQQFRGRGQGHQPLTLQLQSEGAKPLRLQAWIHTSSFVTHQVERLKIFQATFQGPNVLGLVNQLLHSVLFNLRERKPLFDFRFDAIRKFQSRSIGLVEQNPEKHRHKQWHKQGFCKFLSIWISMRAVKPQLYNFELGQGGEGTACHHALDDYALLLWWWLWLWNVWHVWHIWQSDVWHDNEK